MTKRNTCNKFIAILFFAIFMTLSTANAIADNTEYLDTAKRCKQYIVNNNYKYNQGSSKDYPLNADRDRSIDCSGFVSWAVFEYQGGNFEYRTSSWFLDTAKKLYKNQQTDSPEFTAGWVGIKGSENYQPGDILCYNGHVHIYYGPDIERVGRYIVINAGSNKALKEVLNSISYERLSNAQYAIRLPKICQNKISKINSEPILITFLQ